ncbi:MAG: glycosyltransferase [bacterium]
MSFVSVIIPTYNRDWFIGDAIKSVLQQTYMDFEIIIVDDGSTDKTQERIKSFFNKKIKYFYKKNGGAASALNLGIKHSKGKYIARLDSDDIFEPEKLEKQVKLLDSNQDIGLVYTQAYNIDENGNILELYPKNHTCPQESLKTLRHFLFPPSQSIMFRKNCIDKIGYFDENMPITEDWDFCIRMAQYYQFAYIDEPLVKIRKHTYMITANKIETAHAILKVMQKHAKILSMGEGNTWIGQHYYSLGRIYFYKRNYQSAKKIFFQALKYDPRSWRNYIFLGLTYLPNFMIEAIRYLKSIISTYSHLKK